MKKRLFLRVLSILLLVCITVCGITACNEEAEGTETPETEDSSGGTVRAIKVKKKMNKGSVITLSDIYMVEIDPAELPEGYVSKTADAVDRKLLSVIDADEFLTADVLSKSVVKKEEEVKIDADETLARRLGYVIVTDFVDADTGEDISEELQKIIDSNSRKTIYFPDGIYTIAYPLQTSSNADKAVSLHLSQNAVIRASNRWRGRSDYMIQLGVKNKTFSIDQTGTNYYLYGGVIDGNGRANGVALEGGRETSIRNVTIKNAMNGMHVVYNEAYGSNDSDTEWVTIEGCGLGGSVGLLIDGLDNTFSNMRISGFETGVYLTRPGNLMHNIYTKYIEGGTQTYENGRGFYDESGGNWYDVCRAEDYRTAFFTNASSMSLYNDCGALWKSAKGRQIAIETNGGLNASVTNMKAEFFGTGDNIFLLTYADGGNGIIKDPMFDLRLTSNENYLKYLVGRVVWSNS
ncbi:MAG: flagella basal body P-ring formation protein FlgA [Clostridia bacterium]|nr:flagella basal body P-ring formation protein FlgA [Clostridia bacterium]